MAEVGMEGRRRVYRPEVVVTLEDRMVLSAVGPVNPAVFGQGPQMHPVVVATFAGSAKAEVLSRSGKPDNGQLTFGAQEFVTQTPSGSNVGVFEVAYDNESSKAITSATIEDTLGPKLSYVPNGSAVRVDGTGISDAIVQVSPQFSYFPSGSHVPPGGQITVATNAKGSQVVELKLPDGIAPGAKGYVEFAVQAVTPTRK
jgi:hypothetical protein